MRNFEDLQIAVAGTGYGSVEPSRWSSEMLYTITDGGEKLLIQFAFMYALFCKIEKWWINEIKVSINGDFRLGEYDSDNVMSGHMVVVETIIDILANDSNSHFKEVCEQLGIQMK